jgi:hypothetical protein
MLLGGGNASAARKIDPVAAPGSDVVSMNGMMNGKGRYDLNLWGFLMPLLFALWSEYDRNGYSP